MCKKLIKIKNNKDKTNKDKTNKHKNNKKLIIGLIIIVIIGILVGFIFAIIKIYKYIKSKLLPSNTIVDIKTHIGKMKHIVANRNNPNFDLSAGIDDLIDLPFTDEDKKFINDEANKENIFDAIQNIVTLYDKLPEPIKNNLSIPFWESATRLAKILFKNSKSEQKKKAMKGIIKSIRDIDTDGMEDLSKLNLRDVIIKHI